MPRLSTSQVRQYTERQLVQQARRVYDEPLPAIDSLELLPPGGDVEMGAPAYEREVYKSFGRAGWIAGQADDLNRVGVAKITDVYNVEMFGVAYDISLKEQRRAAVAGRNLRDQKARVSRRAILEFHGDSGLYGSAKHGIFGLLSMPYIPRKTAPATIFSGAYTPAEILNFLHSLEEEVEERTEGTERPTQLNLPYGAYNYISRTYVSPLDPTRTILSVFLDNANTINEVKKLRMLNGAGPEGEDVIALGDYADIKAEHNVPDPLSIQAPQFRNLVATVNMVAETGGFATTFPWAHTIVELVPG